MFDVQSESRTGSEQDREIEWMALHAEIKGVWKQRSALEAREIALLLGCPDVRACGQSQLGVRRVVGLDVRQAREIEGSARISPSWD